MKKLSIFFIGYLCAIIAWSFLNPAQNKVDASRFKNIEIAGNLQVRHH